LLGGSINSRVKRRVGISEKRWRRVKTDYSDDDDVYCILQ
jgi:hypothetical protein